MYEPPHFREDRLDVLHGLIRAHPLGLLVSNGPDGPIANQLPFLIDSNIAPYGRLRAHLARANTHWQELAANPQGKVLVVFQGADSYVTPSWYATKQETGKVVPTWNYVMVQVRGTVRVIEDAAWLRQQIAELTSVHESKRDKPWAVTDAPERFIEAQLKGIVGIEIDIAETHGKWKVSQNRPEADRRGVAERLGEARDENNAAAMSRLVRQYGGLGTD
jgi:transcriptional regulator